MYQNPPNGTRKDKEPTALSNLTTGPWSRLLRAETPRAKEIKPNRVNIALLLARVGENGGGVGCMHIAGRI